MLKKLFLILSILSLIVSGCNYSGRLTKRYRKIQYLGTPAIETLVSVDASVIEKDAGPPKVTKGVFDLNEKGQQAFINSMRSMIGTTTPKDLAAAMRLEATLEPTKSLPDILDYSKFDKRILTSITKIKSNEADRIQKISVTIKISDSKFKITNCNRVITEYLNVDLGKLTYANSNSFEGGVSLGMQGGIENTESNSSTRTGENAKTENQTIGTERNSSGGLTASLGASLGASAKFNASRSLTEEVLLRQRVVALSAFVKDNELHLYQQGVSGIDLTGNIIADIQGEYESDILVDRIFSFDDLKKADNSPNGQSLVKVKSQFVQSINITNDVTATVDVTASYRTVKRRHKTTSESDDVVEMIEGTKTSISSFILMPKEKLRPKMWHIQVPGGAAPVLLRFCNGTNAIPILFNNQKNAADFLTWLKAKFAQPSPDTYNNSSVLGDSGYKLYSDQCTTVVDAAFINSLQVSIHQ